ncbi:MAG: 50S ribosomal protein L22 [Thermogutta sp.]|nr:50S ribosomal protein L22 [Thermogutta sp.]HOP77056.1 50S ribosomal protein L22 [Thermogutta sp.]HPU06599.1 50S ribosomal protein L22 [Thermogutta sp.]HPZ83989.1 50S ribosomal protein L22 [Thermogutta sp.]HQF12745.1 50S ribosomal protein L22 [Thermogutta sp.]
MSISNMSRMYRALHRYARISPRKARLVADVVRGKQVDEALAILKTMPHRAARMIEKVVSSALANSADLQDPFPRELHVIRIWVDEGPRLKRLRPLSRGMATIIQRRMCHIGVILGPREYLK